MTLCWIRRYNTLVGLCDAGTGLLLLSAPLLTLQMMGISALPSEPVYLQFIGAFVFSVGTLYWLPQTSSNTEAEERQRSRTVWLSTAIIRTVVCVFVTLQLLSGALVLPWISVALTDGFLAALQFILLRSTTERALE